jgi:hypothetical protein
VCTYEGAGRLPVVGGLNTKRQTVLAEWQDYSVIWLTTDGRCLCSAHTISLNLYWPSGSQLRSTELP